MTGRYKSYPEYKKSEIEWVGCIPITWKIKPTFSVFDPSAVKNVDGKEDTVLSLSYGNIIERDVEKNFGLLPESFNTYQIVNDGDLILRLTDLQNDKKSLRVGRAKQRGIITSAYLKLQSTALIDSRFAYRLLHSYDTTKVFYGMGGGLRQSMKFEDFRRLPIVLPSIEEQQKIANFLDHETAKIDTVIAKQEKLIELLKEKRQAVISHAVTKGLNPDAPMKDSGVEWLGDVPEHWDVKKIKHFGVVIGGFAFKSTDFTDSGYPVVKISNVSHLNIDWSDQSFLPSSYAVEHKDYIAPKGSLVFAMTRPVISGGIKVFLMEDNSAPLINQRVGFIKVKNQSSAFFILQSSQSNSFLAQFTNNMTITNQPNISGEGIGSISIPFPPPSELTDINEKLTKLELTFKSLTNKATDAISLMKERKTALISAAVTGKIDVRNWKPKSSIRDIT